MAFLNPWRWLVLVSLFAIGCAMDTTRFNVQGPQQEGAAVVYLYRPAAVANVLLTPQIRVDVSAPLALQNGEFHRFELPAGQHVFRLEAIEDYTEAQQLDIESRAGQVTYLRLQATMQFETGVHYRPYRRAFQLAEMRPDTALDEIRHCRDAAATKPPVLAGDDSPATDKQPAPAVFSIDKNSRPFGY